MKKKYKACIICCLKFQIAGRGIWQENWKSWKMRNIHLTSWKMTKSLKNDFKKHFMSTVLCFHGNKKGNSHWSRQEVTEKREENWQPWLLLIITWVAITTFGDYSIFVVFHLWAPHFIWTQKGLIHSIVLKTLTNLELCQIPFSHLARWTISI